MNEKNNKSKTIVVVLILVALIFLGVGITYAVILYEGGSENNVMKTGNISMSYTEPSNAYILDNALPIEDNLAIATEHGFEFQVMSNATTNVNDHEGIEIPYEVTMSKMSNGNGIYDLPEDKIKIYVINTDTHEVVLGPTLISQITDISQKDNSKVLFKKTNIHKEGQGSITTSYKLIAWLDKSYVINNNDSKSYQYKFKINVNASSASLDVKDNVAPSINASVEGLNITFNATDATGVTGYAITDTTDVPTNWTTVESTKNLTKTVTVNEYKTYYIHVKDVYNNTKYVSVETKKLPKDDYSNNMLGYKILNTNIQDEETKVSDTATSGLYKSTRTSGNPTYYYKGNITNNWVKFGKEGSKDLLWRVVRVNEDGSIKIILQDGINNNTEYTFNADSSSESKIYYDTSELKPIVNNWYSNTFSADKTKIITNSNFCVQERSLSTDAASYEPTFQCNNSLTLTAGLLSVDEALFAGIPKPDSPNKINTSNYLYNTANGMGWWMINTGMFNRQAYAWSFDNGLFKQIYLFATRGTLTTRPVINLKSNVTVKGTGMQNDPYVIE